jgi:hypothetical protein
MCCLRLLRLRTSSLSFLNNRRRLFSLPRIPRQQGQSTRACGLLFLLLLLLLLSLISHYICFPFQDHSFAYSLRSTPTNCFLSRLAMGALEFLSDRRFHQSYVLPPNPETGRHQAQRFSYADFGDSKSNAVVFFCGALMGTRLCCSHLDRLAFANNVRIIHVDRPGIGGSDPVDLEKRIEIWLGQSFC